MELIDYKGIFMFELLNKQLKANFTELTGEFFQKLIASDGSVNDNFGIWVSMSVDGSTVVVGANGDDNKGTDSGSAYIFTRQANGSYTQTQKLVASDGAAGDNLGVSVSVSGDGSIVVLGAYRSDDKGADSGSAYVFTRQANGSYVQTQKLVASDGAAGDNFGISVSVSSDASVLVVGAYWDDDKGTDSGSVYIFTKQANGSYLQTQKLTASDGAANDYFGYSIYVSSDGKVIAVGSYLDDDKGDNSGSVYVFTKQADGSYLRTQKLTASDGAVSDQFGISLSISADGSVIIVGAFADDDKGADSGSAYIFTKQANGDYSQSQKLTASDGASSDLFGQSVSVSGDGSVIVIGAYADDDKGSSSGSAYIFTKQANGSYLQTQKLTASDGAAGDYFSDSVSVSGDGSVIVVGGDGDDDKGTASGSAYIFTKQANGNYLQVQKLTAFDGAANDRFGYSVCVSDDGRVIAVGAYGDDDKGTESGSVYIFTKQSSGNYSHAQKLTPSSDAPGATMGRVIDISSENTVVTGARYDTVNGKVNAGSVYIFK